MTSLDLNHILLPTDFSETADKALTFALELALRKKARLTLMHTIEEPYDFAPMIDEYRSKLKRNVESLLLKKIDEILEQERFQTLQIDTRVLIGPTVFSIMEAANEEGVDFIVMGTTGATGINKVLFGSNTTEIILRTEIPLLAIPEGTTYNGLSYITFMTDYNDGDLRALAKTADLAKAYNAEISVLHIAQSITLREEIMRRGFEDLASKQISHDSIKFELIAGENLTAGINEFLALQDISMLVLVKYKKPFFSKLLHKSHSQEMGFYAKHPLLILNGEET